MIGLLIRVADLYAQAFTGAGFVKDIVALASAASIELAIELIVAAFTPAIVVWRRK